MFKIPTDPMIMFIIPTQTPVLKTNNVGIVNTSWSISQIWDLGIQSGEYILGTQLAYGLEQITGLERKKDENPLWKHCQIAHNFELVKFKMVCLKSFKSAFMRQVNEGVRIENSKADICMNSKAEFHQPSIVRVSTVLGNHNDEQTGGGVRGRGVRHLTFQSDT